MNSNWSYSPETLNSGKNLQLFVPCDLEIWRMTSINSNRAPLYYVKLCASFQSHCWIQNWVKVPKRSFRVKMSDFFRLVWPRNSILCLALCIISKPSMSCKWSDSPETRNLGQNRWILSRVTLKFDRWPCKTIKHIYCATSSFLRHFITTCEFKLEL